MADIDKLTSNFGKQRISTNTYEKECEAFLSQKNIPFGGVKVQRSAQGQVDASSNCSIRTNLFKIHVKEEKRIMQHRVEIRGYRESRNDYDTSAVILFNDGDCASFFKTERRAICSRIFDAFVERNQDVLPSRDELYYDQQFDLFSTKKILLNKRLTFRTKDVFREDLENIVTRPAFRDVDEFEIKIEYVKTIPTYELLEVMANKFDEQSLEIVRFVNISTSQHLFTNTDQHTNLSNGLTYFNDFPPSFESLPQMKDLPGRVFISAGLKKSAKIVGPGTKFSRSFTVSPKLTLFYRPERFLRSFESLIQKRDWAQIDKMIKGLYICPSHLLAREGDAARFVIAKVVGLGQPATKTFFKREEQDISVADYYTRVLGIRLADPNYPVVECKQRGSTIFYPLDVCEILDKQRVSTGALNAELTSALIREAATLPSLLQRRIKDCFNELKLVGSSFMQNAGMEVVSEPVELDAPIMKSPLMNYKNGQNAIFDLESGCWRTSRLGYLSSGESVTWAIYGFVRGQHFSQDNLVKFASAYHQMCNTKGLRLPEPGECQVSSPISLKDDFALEKAMRDCFERVVKPYNCRFIMIVTNAEDVSVHSYLKALEQEYGIVTQNVTSKVAMSTIDNLRPRLLTLENIANKTNVKLGGVNYRVLNGSNSSLGERDLFIGFCFQQANGGFGRENLDGPPTVFSYASNDIKDPIAFTGDFIYHQNSVRGNLASFEQAMGKICSRRKAINTPNRVIVYRHGASDGDFQYVSMYEVPLLRKIIDEQFGASVPLVLCIVTKNHSMFFTPTNFEVKQDRFGKQITGAKVENLQHGTLISQEVTSSFYDEFYLSGSKALQGTSKFSRYIVICNDAKMDLAELQTISYELGFAFQIIPSPVSFPAPIQIALDYAKRGRNLYNSDLNSRKVEAAGSYEELTNVLSYDRSSERSKRVNA